MCQAAGTLCAIFNNISTLKKLTILIFSVIVFTNSFGQIKLDNSITTQEFNFFYKDSIDNKVSFGDYEPTGLVSFDDGSLIISTEFSIDFPLKYQMPDSFNKENFKIYYEQQKLINSKSHVSSGSVFKLNSNFEKLWEIFFKEKRVMKISKLPDQSIIIAGDRVDMQKFWMAHIDTSGKVIWQKEYKLKSKSMIKNMVIDSLGNCYLLAESERIVPISITKNYGKRRIRLFRQTEMEGNIYLLKVTSNGNVLWATCLDNKKRFEKFAYQLFIDGNIYASSSYEGFVKEKNEWKRKEGKLFFEVSPRGKILKSNNIDNHFMYHCNGNHYSVTSNEDTLILYTETSFNSIVTDTIIFVKPVKSIWISGFLTINNYIYLLGSKDHNLGCIVIQLNKENRYIGYWNDKRSESTELVDAIVKADGTIIVISNCFKVAKGTNNELIRYINITIMKKNGT